MTFKTALAAAVIVAFGSATAHAETTQDCLKATFEVAQAAQEKSPTANQMSALEEQMSKVERLCDGKQFAEADTARTDLKAMIEKM